MTGHGHGHGHAGWWEALDPRVAEFLGAAARRGFGGPGRGPGHGPRGFGPGWGGWMGPGGGGRGHRARRGDVRAAVLTLLAEEPRNGYGLMQEIERRSGGVWRPSPGSIYPALSQLEDEGLVRAEHRDGGRVFVLTDAGRAQVQERPPGTRDPWETAPAPVDDRVFELANGARQAAMALFQIAQVGNDAQIAAAREVLADARRRLYGILADADEADPPEVREA